MTTTTPTGFDQARRKATKKLIRGVFIANNGARLRVFVDGRIRVITELPRGKSLHSLWKVLRKAEKAARKARL